MTCVTEIRLFRDKKLFVVGSMRIMTGRALAEFDRIVHKTIHESFSIVACETEVRHLLYQKIFAVIAMRIMAGSAVSHNYRLMD
jgi:hypothetical protein